MNSAPHPHHRTSSPLFFIIPHDVRYRSRGILLNPRTVLFDYERVATAHANAADSFTLHSRNYETLVCRVEFLVENYSVTFYVTRGLPNSPLCPFTRELLVKMTAKQTRLRTIFDILVIFFMLHFRQSFKLK